MSPSKTNTAVTTLTCSLIKSSHRGNSFYLQVFPSTERHNVNQVMYQKIMVSAVTSTGQRSRQVSAGAQVGPKDLPVELMFPFLVSLTQILT